MQQHTVRLTVLTTAIVCGTVAIGAGRHSFDSLSKVPSMPHDGIIFVQAQDDTSSDQAQLSETDTASEIDPDLPEEILLAFLADPQAFIADPRNADLIAAVVRQAIARDPANADAMIALVDDVSDPAAIDAVADGIAQAAGDFADAGDTDASSQILAKVAVAPSRLLSEAVQSKANQISTVAENTRGDEASPAEQVVSEESQDGEASQQTDIVSDAPADVVSDEGVGTEPQANEAAGSEQDTAALSDGETLSEPASDAPSLAAAQTSATGGVDGGNTSISNTSSTSGTTSATPRAAQSTSPVAFNIPATNSPSDGDAAPGPIPLPASRVIP
ncbi:hypothetical protein [Roseobacter sp. AzwK-3b]|uniref:hypothetical protein n=1 Tax=Roseobacter sp. AzwK-3b TaxID=351016 RepID=UPI0002F99FFB|nr:hypothetical protein [Roseobacter sp. AzwK-3b]